MHRLYDTREDYNCKQAAERIKHAYNKALSDGCKTRDLGGDLTTTGFTDALIERL